MHFLRLNPDSCTRNTTCALEYNVKMIDRLKSIEVLVLDVMSIFNLKSLLENKNKILVRRFFLCEYITQITARKCL